MYIGNKNPSRIRNFALNIIFRNSVKKGMVLNVGVRKVLKERYKVPAVPVSF